ncbi:MAG TPA: type II secretion system protein [Vicinamibacterales bacterium]|nr:type II secretion system protein [Vicinamibacterales bacterium]
MAIHKPAATNESGFTLVDLLFCCSLIGLLSTLAIPGLMRARGVAQSASAVGTLRVVNSAQLSFAVTCGSGFYAPDLPALGMKPPSAVTAFLPPELSSGATFIKSGYTFSLSATPLAGAPASCNGLSVGEAAPGYVAIADPLDAADTPHFFGTNADGTIYQHGSSLASTMPESGPASTGTPIK